MKVKEQQNKLYRPYLISFSTGRIKVGITSDWRERSKYYRQEARRHGFGIVAYRPSSWFVSKKEALRIERNFCKLYKDICINNHREWFYGDYEKMERMVRMLDRLCEFANKRKIELSIVNGTELFERLNYSAPEPWATWNIFREKVLGASS